MQTEIKLSTNQETTKDTSEKNQFPPTVWQVIGHSGCLVRRLIFLSTLPGKEEYAVYLDATLGQPVRIYQSRIGQEGSYYDTERMALLAAKTQFQDYVSLIDNQLEELDKESQ